LLISEKYVAITQIFFVPPKKGIRGQRTVDWRLVDEAVSSSKFEERVQEKVQEMAATLSRSDIQGYSLSNLEIESDDNSFRMSLIVVDIDRVNLNATITPKGADGNAPTSTEEVAELNARWYMLDLVRQLDEAILHLCFNEPEIGTIIFKTTGDSDKVKAHDDFMNANADNNWLVNEVRLYWKRTLKCIDLTFRTLLAFVESGSCFTGVLAEFLLTLSN